MKSRGGVDRSLDAYKGVAIGGEINHRILILVLFLGSKRRLACLREANTKVCRCQE